MTVTTEGYPISISNIQTFKKLSIRLTIVCHYSLHHLNAFGFDDTFAIWITS